MVSPPVSLSRRGFLQWVCSWHYLQESQGWVSLSQEQQQTGNIPSQIRGQTSVIHLLFGGHDTGGQARTYTWAALQELNVTTIVFLNKSCFPFCKAHLLGRTSPHMETSPAVEECRLEGSGKVLSKPVLLRPVSSATWCFQEQPSLLALPFLGVSLLVSFTHPFGDCLTQSIRGLSLGWKSRMLCDQ